MPTLEQAPQQTLQPHPGEQPKLLLADFGPPRPPVTNTMVGGAPHGEPHKPFDASEFNTPGIKDPNPN